jgi:hypothetical protein
MAGNRQAAADRALIYLNLIRIKEEELKWHCV